jgi:AmmeMemoRadiSam system protein A
MTTTRRVSPVDEGSATDPLAAEGSPSPVALDPEAGAILLRLARAVVAATAAGRPSGVDLAALLPPSPPPLLGVPAAAFVTLHEHGALRGCVGYLAADRPLWETVVSAAAGAASRDPRFLPVAEWEVMSLSIDVSVLGSPVPLADPAAFRPGIDGVIVERGGRRALLLPEVATDQGWGAQEMLEAVCRKAGLPRDAWRDRGTSLQVFRTARVSESRTPG